MQRNHNNLYPKIVVCSLLAYLPSYLGQETAKWPLRSSESSCHLLLLV